LALCEAGRRDEARPLFEDTLPGLPTLRRDFDWVITMCFAILVGVKLGEAHQLEYFYQPLAPLSGRVWWNRNTCSGPVDFYLGVLAAALKRFDAAEGHFALAATLDAPAWEARVALYHAHMLMQRDAAGDAARAAQLARHALDVATRLRIDGVAVEAQELFNDHSTLWH